jgi:transcriptional regulator with XRE-family HTH domain
MAAKGDKARLYDVAFRMYTADGKSLTEIEAALGVSRQTLSAWKADTLRPDQDMDDWDLARRQKRSNVARLRALFDRELTALEEAQPGTLAGGSLDGITKLGTLVQRWEAAEVAGAGIDRPALFLENLQWLAAWLREHDPEGLKVLANNFDALTLAFKMECLNTGAANGGNA